MAERCPLCGDGTCCERNSKIVRKAVSKKQNLITSEATKRFADDKKFMDEAGAALRSTQTEGLTLDQQDQLLSVAQRFNLLLESNTQHMGMVGVACSFCGSQTDPNTGQPILMAGPGVTICEVCVESCLKALNEIDQQRATQAEQVEQVEQQPQPAPPPQAIMGAMPTQAIEAQVQPRAPAPPQAIQPPELTPEQYEGLAAEIDRLVSLNPTPDSPEGRRLNQLLPLAEAYETAHFPEEEASDP